MDNELLTEIIASSGIPEMLVTSFSTYPYEIIFALLLVGGGAILFPAFYLSVLGALTWWHIIGIMVLAGMFADTFWYLVGRGALPAFIESRIEKGRYLKKISDITSGKELIILFYSKFIYGTRIAVQLLCGARNVSFFAYTLINACAVVILGTIYYLIVRFSAAGIGSLGELKYKVVLVLSVAMFVIGTLHLIVYRLFGKRIMRQG